MKLSSRLVLILIGALLLLVPVAISFWTPAQAQLGNTGVPVHCAVGVSSTPQVLICGAADGTVFVNNRVPTGYYLHVTDVIIAPSSSADTQADIEAQDANNTLANDLLVQTISFASQGQHFTSLALVLPAQYRLRAVSFNGAGFIVEVFGLLTRNVTYTPLIVR